MSTSAPTPAHEHIEKTLDLLFESGQVIEIRALDVSRQGYQRPHTEAGYFDGANRHPLIEAAEKLTGTAKGVYVVLNPFNPALLARSANRVQPGISATSDSDIRRRRWILGDIDADNPSGTSASEQEHEAAIEAAWTVYEDLRARGFSDMAVAASGNGAHICIPVDLPVDDGGLVKRVLEAASLMYDRDGIHVDVGVHNPARITKLISTMARKGDSIADRPHRASKWLYIPETVESVPVELLERFASLAPVPPSAALGHAKGDFDIEGWLVDHGVPIRRGPEPWPSHPGARRWQLDECVNGHRDQAPYLLQFSNGALAAGCLHNSCQDLNWHQFRQHYEPNYQPSDPSSGTPPVAEDRNIPFYTASELSASGSDSTEWIVDDMVAAGAITELDGKIKLAGKTTLLTYLARKVLDGQPSLGYATTKSPVVYLTEQPMSSFLEALRRADLQDRVDFHVLRWTDVLGVPWDETAAAAVVRAVELGALLIVDTLPQFAAIRGDGENSSARL